VMESLQFHDMFPKCTVLGSPDPRFKLTPLLPGGFPSFVLLDSLGRFILLFFFEKKVPSRVFLP
jgi:hypothetical protein